MLVVCVDNMRMSDMTIGKVYKVISKINGINNKYLQIETDPGHLYWYESNCFKPISEIRKNKLKKIC